MTNTLSLNPETCVAAFPPYGAIPDAGAANPAGRNVTLVRPYQPQTELCYNPQRIDRGRSFRGDIDDTPVTGSDPTTVQPCRPGSQGEITWLRAYTPVPAARLNGQSLSGLPIWRIELWGLDEDDEPLGFDVVDDAIIGRGPDADIALDDYDAQQRGVSRRHLLLRPGRQQLMLIDLDSTNGVAVNGEALARGGMHAISQGDVLTLGRLSFIVNIVEPPPDVTYRPRHAEN